MRIRGLLPIVMILLGHTPRAAARDVEACKLVGSSRAPATLRVYEEKRDGAKGRLLFKEQLVHEGDVIGIATTDRGRIVFEYRYGADDVWKAVAAWCHRDDVVEVP